MEPSGPAAHFDVIAQRDNDRPDKATTYYVVIDSVDLSTADFKRAVKRVLRSLAADNGGPVFSASIWDHLSAAQTDVSYRSNPDLFSGELMKAKQAFNNRHLIANYSGGLAAADEPPGYVLFWFPEARANDGAVGQWVSAEVWKP